MRDDETVEVGEPTEATEQAAGAESTENQEASTEAPATEPPAEATAQAEPAGPTPEEIEAKFKAFTEAVTEAVNERDTSTGMIPEQFVGKVKLAYSELPLPKTKTAARGHLDENMKSALGKDLDAAKAKAYMDLGQEVKTTAATRETVVRPPVDPTQAHVEKVAAFYLAVSMIPVGEGVDPSWTQKVQELSKSLSGDVAAWTEYQKQHDAWLTQVEALKEGEARPEEPQAPEVSQVVVNAAKISRGRGVTATRPRKATGTGTATSTSATPRAAYTGVRRDVKKHIASAFADKPIGTFLKIGLIAKHTSAEYGDDHPSSGAVTASLNSAKFNVAGIVPAEENNIAGARKIA